MINVGNLTTNSSKCKKTQRKRENLARAKPSRGVISTEESDTCGSDSAPKEHELNYSLDLHLSYPSSLCVCVCNSGHC